MATSNKLSELWTSVVGFATARPRLCLTLLLMVVLVAAQGSVAAAADPETGLSDVGTTAEADSDLGP